MNRDPIAEIARAHSALQHLDPGTDRETWVRTGMAAKAAGLDFDAWHEWSATAGNYKGEADCRHVWQSIKPGPVTAASLFGMARAAGWIDDGEAPAVRPLPHQERPPRQPEAPKPPPHDPAAVWAACRPASADQEYVVRKKGLPDGLRTYHGRLTVAGQACDGSLVLPVRTLDGVLVSLQFVPPEGKKVFLAGCKLPADGSYVVGQIKPEGIVYVTEGIGQSWAVHQATRAPAACCFGVGRLSSVATALRERYPAARLVLVADAGKESQCAAIAKAVSGAWVEMPEGCPPNHDVNDVHLAEGLQAVAALLARTKEAPRRFKLAERTADRLFIGEPLPVSWLVRGILPLGIPCVLASPPNVGKSMLSLDLAAKVAAYPGRHSAYSFGAEVAAHGRAIYVSAEDAEPEIHRRLWSLCAGQMPDRLHVLSLPDVGHFGVIEADRTTREYRPTEAWRDLVDEIRELPDVKLVVLDTLQAMAAGDTNTVEATQPLMNEATALASAVGATVLLVHHVSKGSTREIKTSLDAMEAIRGSGAITGSARAAYVMWPPADGGREVCGTLGEPYQEGKIAFGIVAKKYGDSRRDRSVFVRDDRGVLQDRTQKYNELLGSDDSDTLRAALAVAIRGKWQEGVSFAASQGTNGIHARRFELPAGFHEKTRPWFEEQVGKMLSDGTAKRLPYRGGGARLCPPEATAAVPKPAPEGIDESINPEGEYAADVSS